MENITCNYCGQEAKLVSGDVIYPYTKKYKHNHFWFCASCDAYVGCHSNSRKNAPKGTLANKELREWRIKAHSAFDPIWKSKTISRLRAYRWLAGQLDIKVSLCHIGLFDVATCQKVVTLCTDNVFFKFFLKKNCNQLQEGISDGSEDTSGRILP